MLRVSSLVPLLAVILLSTSTVGQREVLAASGSSLAQSTVYAEDWEGGIGSWFADNGVWEVGVPTSGPGTAYQGTQCAATVLAGNYPVGANSRLISPAIALPASPLDGRIELRFWHWFSLDGGDGDSARVELSTTGTGGPWQRISNVFTNPSGGWTHYIADLSAYAGQTVRIAFRLRDLTVGLANVAAGWYVDEIRVCEGAPAAWPPEGFEGGVGGWFADRGVWQVGAPTSGPGAAYAGAQCAATILNGNYPVGSDSRLISPAVTLEAAPQDGRLWLSFWHWFSLDGGDGDSAWVELSTTGTGGPWQRISNVFTNPSGGWTHYIADLSAYAGQTVRIAFRLRDLTVGLANVAAGWYVDEIRVLEGPFRWLSPESFDDLVGLPPPIGGWYADRGVWQVGAPSAPGPPSGFQSRFCAGTILNGNHPVGCDSRLISPAVTLEATPQDGKLWLSFWHWFSLDGGDGDSAWVEISTTGTAGPWQRISNAFTHPSGGWTHYVADLSAYAGQTVRIAFRLRDLTSGNPNVAAGWYVDNPSITAGRLILNNPEGFEHGTRGWLADRGVWQMGEPTSGPGAAHTGTRCAATVLDGNYPIGADSRLVMPPFLVPAGAELRFWHWFSLDGGDGDSAWVEISTTGTAGPWQRISNVFTGISGGWTQYIADLSSYAGQTVRVAFHLRDLTSGIPNVTPGWYVDDVRVVGLPEGSPIAPDLYFIDYSYSPTGPPVLHWTNPPGPFDLIAIYAGRHYDFEPDLGNRIALVTGTSFTDMDRPGNNHIYRISAVDSDNHESLIVRPDSVTAVEPLPGGPDEPMRVLAAPNPFQRTMALSFRLVRRGHVRLDVLSVAGRLVARLADEIMEPGWQTRSFDAGDLAAGVYFYRLTASGEVRSGKLALIR